MNRRTTYIPPRDWRVGALLLTLTVLGVCGSLILVKLVLTIGMTR